MYGGYIDSLRTIPEFIFIAETINRQCPAYEIKSPLKQGEMDRFFLLDTVRHISRSFNQAKASRKVKIFHILSWDQLGQSRIEVLEY